MRSYIALISIIFCSSTFKDVLAADMTCKPIASAKCDCPAPLIVSCPGYAQARYISYKQLIKSAEVELILKNDEKIILILHDPSETLVTISSTQYSADVLKEITKQKIDPANIKSSKLLSFVVDETTTLYDSAGKIGDHELTGLPIAKKDADVARTCNWVKKSEAVPAINGNENIILCVGEVNCNGSRAFVGCKQVNNTCPTADICAADPDVGVKNKTPYLLHPKLIPTPTLPTTSETTQAKPVF